jgi:hypothetical protein
MASPCVNDPDGPCRLIAEHGGPDWLAHLANWLMGTPLRLLLIVAVALLANRLVRRALRRAVALGMVIERRGPDGAFHLAVSSEGWNLHRSG